MLADTRRTAEQFNKRLYNTWKRPIDNLETLIELSMESAIMFVNTLFKGKTNSSSTLLYNIHLGKSIDRLELTNIFSTSQKELIKTLKNNYKYVIAFG